MPNPGGHWGPERPFVPEPEPPEPPEPTPEGRRTRRPMTYGQPERVDIGVQVPPRFMEAVKEIIEGTGLWTSNGDFYRDTARWAIGLRYDLYDIDLRPYRKMLQSPKGSTIITPRLTPQLAAPFRMAARAAERGLQQAFKVISSAYMQAQARALNYQFSKTSEWLHHEVFWLPTTTTRRKMH